MRRGALGYLRQDPRQHREDDAITGLEYILSARDLVEMARRAGEGPDRSSRRIPPTATSRRFARLEEEYRDAGGYQAESEARTITAGLGLAQDRLRLPVGALSGGERRRLELARILFGGSDLLLLDEPTNHLDADAKAWLMRFLAGYKGALMVVSHDLGAARRVDHADPAPRSRRRRRVPGHVLAVPRGARRATRSGSRRSRRARSRRSAG